MDDVVVSFEKVGHAYRPGRWVFRHYSAQITKGSIFAILGPNGCGKTTLLKVLLGALKASEGAIIVRGQTAFVPQIFQVSFDYTALDMVLMGRARRVGLFAQPSREDEEAAVAALDKFGIAGLASQPFHELSGGQRQLVIFARALVAEADLLILDEPTSALDLKNQALILDWIIRLSREHGLTIILTTHNPHHALAVADNACLMVRTEEHLVGRATDILSEPKLTSLYGVPLKRVSFEHHGQSGEGFVPVLPTNFDKRFLKDGSQPRS